MGKSLVKPAITVMRRYNAVIIKEAEIFSYFLFPSLLINTFFFIPLNCKELTFLVEPTKKNLWQNELQKEPQRRNLTPVCQDWRFPEVTQFLIVLQR